MQGEGQPGARERASTTCGEKHADGKCGVVWPGGISAAARSPVEAAPCALPSPFRAPRERAHPRARTSSARCSDKQPSRTCRNSRLVSPPGSHLQRGVVVMKVRTSAALWLASRSANSLLLAPTVRRSYQGCALYGDHPPGRLGVRPALTVVQLFAPLAACRPGLASILHRLCAFSSAPCRARALADRMP